MMPRSDSSGGPYRRALLGAFTVSLICLLILAAVYIRQQKQLAEMQQELTLLHQRDEATHNQLWHDEVYIPYLEQRLTADHEKGTPTEWRALAMQADIERQKEEAARREAGMAAFGQRMQKRNEARNGGGH
jgi:hypothetical protein